MTEQKWPRGGMEVGMVIGLPPKARASGLAVWIGVSGTPVCQR